MPGKSKDATNPDELKKFEFKKDKMQTKPYGIEDRKVKIEKLMSQKEIEKLKKEGSFGLYARPESEKKNTSAGKTAPPERMSREPDMSPTLKNFKSGGRVNLRGGGMCKRGMNKKAYGRNS